MKIFIKGEFRLTLIELDTDIYEVNNPEPHTLIEEEKYRKLFYWNGVYPQKRVMEKVQKALSLEEHIIPLSIILSYSSPLSPN